MLKRPNVYSKRATINSFANGMRGTKSQKRLDVSRAKFFHNFDLSDGTLKSGIGVSNLNGNDNISSGNLTLTALYPYIKYDVTSGKYVEYVVYYAQDKCLYLANVNGKNYEKISTQTFSEVPDFIEYNYLDSDVLLVSTSAEGLFVLDGKNLTAVDGAPPLTSLCMHNERTFATGAGEGKSLWFSDDFDPTNWAISLSEAGFISFAGDQGKLLKAVSFLGYVYVFCEYGILRVIASGDQEEFSVDNLYGKQGKIYGETVTECGDFIVMLTSSGFYAFNGLSATKILQEYDEVVLSADNQNAKGVFDGQNVYFILNVNVSGEVQKAVLKYDVRNKTSYLSLNIPLVDVCYYKGSQNKVLALTSNALKPCVIDDGGQIFGENLLKSWESEYCDFSIAEKNKNLKKVSVDYKGDCALTIITENKSVSHNFKGYGQGDFYPCIRGESFKFKITSLSSETEIYKLSFQIDYVKENV